VRRPYRALAQSLALQAKNRSSGNPVAEGPRKMAEAAELAERARRLDPQNEGIDDVPADHAAWHGDGMAAVRAAEAALARNPKAPRRYSKLARAYLEIGQCARAIELLTQGIKLDPRNVDAADFFDMSHCLFMAGQDAAAIDWMPTAKDMNPYWTDTHVDLAMAYARLGDRDRSRAEREALPKKWPTYDPSVYFGTTIDQLSASDRETWEKTIRPAWRLANLPE
jgi:tetratricopeptide (TPR) repeat protein